MLKSLHAYGSRFSILALVWGCMAVLFLPRGLVAQIDTTQWRSGSVTLSQGWRSHVGDDLAWAQPGFDDSRWQEVEIDNLGAAQRGWRWFRLRIKLAPGHGHEHLLIVGGEGVYVAYLNGEPVEDTLLRPWLSLKRPIEEIIPLPDDATDITIALRTHTTQTYALWHLPLFLTVAAGSPDAIDDDRASFESQRIYSVVPSVAINLALVLAGIGALALFRSQRTRQEYMWLSLWLLLLGISNGLLYCSAAGVISLAWNNVLGDPLIYLCTVMQIQFTFCFAGRQVSKIWRVYQACMIIPYGVNLLVAMGMVSTSDYVVLEAAAILPAAILFPVLLYVWYRRGNREAGWLIVPSLFPAATTALYDVGNASIFAGWGRADFLANPMQLGPIPLQLSDLGDLLLVLAIGVVMFFRFTRVSQEQARGAAELEAARELQQRLVPAEVPAIRGYSVEAAYFPAQEVGGDFYQVFNQGEGSQIVVVGDVSGKGLKAAMTGALALGALRALAAEGLAPAAMLQRLNHQIAETGQGGFITCICMRMDDSGMIVVANAGHLPPYCNGEEWAVYADLPLGIFLGQRYEEQTFHLNMGDRLTLLSDGVLEARNAHGVLFGFERTKAISTQGAAEIAMEARRYGQEDDITVLTLFREAEPGATQSGTMVAATA